MLALTSNIMLPAGVLQCMRACVLFIITHLNIPTSGQLLQLFMHRKHCTVSNKYKPHPTAFAQMLVYSVLCNESERKAFA